MEYNTQREPIRIREYGRNIQNLINASTETKDKEKRNLTAEAIVNLMEMLKPQMKSIDEYRHKLWDHLYIISDFKIELDSPYPKPKKEDIKLNQKPITYPKKDIQYKHFGINVEQLVKKASAVKDPEKQKAFVNCIGSYMKLVARNRNKDNTNTESVKSDILHLAAGKLKIDWEVDFDQLIRTAKPPKRSPRRDYKHKSNSYKKRGRKQGYR